jgi:urate oxidase
MIELAENQYGKSRVRLMKVERDETPHRVFEWNVEVWLTGDFTRCFLEGDNSAILPTDTMKNTVYSVARASSANNIEEFALELVGHFLANQPQIEGAGVRIRSAAWVPIETSSRTHTAAFIQTGPECATVRVTQSRDHPAEITSGIDQLTILKTARSGFAGFKKDRLTTLKETHDRLLGTAMTANWSHTQASANFDGIRASIRDSLLATFAEHDSQSVQQTLYAMARAALEAAREVSAIHLSMPNKHCNLVDLSPFGQDNPNHIFVPTDEPHGSIQATVRRVE